MSLTLSSAARRLAEADAKKRPPEALAIDQKKTWADLVKWYAWAGQFDNWVPAFEALPLDSDIRELYTGLLWSMRHFVPAIPADLQVGDWLGKCKLVLECCIEAGLDEGLTVEELSKPNYMTWALELAVTELGDTEAWADWGAPVAAPAPPVEVVEVYLDEPALALDPDPPPPPPLSQQESIRPDVGEVSSNGHIKVKYIGRERGQIMTTAGLKTLVVGEEYTVTTETWQQIQEYRQQRNWEKI